jgi:hypothetical protein
MRTMEKEFTFGEITKEILKRFPDVIIYFMGGRHYTFTFESKEYEFYWGGETEDTFLDILRDNRQFCIINYYDIDISD